MDIILSKGPADSPKGYQTRMERAVGAYLKGAVPQRQKTLAEAAYLKGAGSQRQKTLAEAAEEALCKLSKWGGWRSGGGWRDGWEGATEWQ